MEKTRIAGLNVWLDCSTHFSERLPAYRAGDAGDPDLIVRSELSKHLEQIDGTVLAETAHNRVIRTADGRLCVCSLSGSDKRVAAASFYRDGYTAADILIADCGSEKYLRELEYQKTYYAFSNRVLAAGGVILHGSAVYVDGEAVIFSAPSGTGKSTHSALWQKYSAEPVMVINDDRPVIRFHDGKPWVYGAPWSGKSDVNANLSAPLRAIVVLRQAKECASEQLDTAEKLFHLTGETSRPFYDKQLGLASLDAVEKLALSVPMYRLCCDISKNAVNVCRKAVFGD